MRAHTPTYLLCESPSICHSPHSQQWAFTSLSTKASKGYSRHTHTYTIRQCPHQSIVDRLPQSSKLKATFPLNERTSSKSNLRKKQTQTLSNVIELSLNHLNLARLLIQPSAKKQRTVLKCLQKKEETSFKNLLSRV